MALNMVFADVDAERFVAEVGEDVAPGTPLLLGDTPVVTVTGSGDYDGNSVAITSASSEFLVAGGRGGVGLADTEATVTPSGTWAFPVVGATALTVEAGTTPVYITEAGALTLTEGTNDLFGVALFFMGKPAETTTAVKIGR